MQDSIFYIIIQTFHCRWKIIEYIDICIGYSFFILSDVWWMEQSPHMYKKSWQTTANLSENLH